MNEPVNDGSSFLGRAAGTALAFGGAVTASALSIGAGSLMVRRAIKGPASRAVKDTAKNITKQNLVRPKANASWTRPNNLKFRKL